MSKDCSGWWHTACVIRAQQDGQLADICVLAGQCLYDAQRSELSADFLEVQEAWSNKRLCLYTPAIDMIRLARGEERSEP